MRPFVIIPRCPIREPTTLIACVELTVLAWLKVSFVKDFMLGQGEKVLQKLNVGLLEYSMNLIQNKSICPHILWHFKQQPKFKKRTHPFSPEKKLRNKKCLKPIKQIASRAKLSCKNFVRFWNYQPKQQPKKRIIKKLHNSNKFWPQTFLPFFEWITILMAIGVVD